MLATAVAKCSKALGALSKLAEAAVSPVGQTASALPTDSMLER